MSEAMKIDGPEELGEGVGGAQALWSREIKAAQQFSQKFTRSAKKINDRYLDKRTDMEVNGTEFRVNLFWSTVQVVMSMLYAQPPKADVKRLYDDFNDEASRVGSQIMERLLNNDVASEGSTTNSSIQYAIQDYVIVGFGQTWVRYDVQTATQVLEDGTEYEGIVGEDAPVDYVHWNDFLYSPARVWEEVRWVAKRSYLTKEKLEDRFGQEVADAVPMAGKTGSSSNDIKMPSDPWNRAEVWEIWDKRTKKVYWFVEGADSLLDERDDPLQLENFWPCPQPLMTNVSTTELVPRSDYVMAQDQFEQLDEINTRITYLTRAMKVVGVYDRSAEGVQRMLSQAVENQLIPVDNWAMFAESGGLKAKIDWLPVAEVAGVVERLVGLREQVKGQIYEVLGISDIMRGNSKASETLGAQQIKAQFGSTRLQLKQMYVAMFVQRAMSIKAEIIARHFQPQTIADQSNVLVTPDAQFAQPAIELIKNPDVAKYRVKVQADSLAYIDRTAENEVRTAALTAIGQFIQQVMGLTDKLPGAAPYMLELVRWYGSGFKGFQEIEGIMDKAIDAANQASQQPPEPNPMQEAELAETQAKAIERRAGAVQKLADAGVKTAQSMGPYPAPPEQFVNGARGSAMRPQIAPGGAGAQMGAMPPPGNGLTPGPGTSAIPPGATPQGPVATAQGLVPQAPGRPPVLPPNQTRR